MGRRNRNERPGRSERLYVGVSRVVIEMSGMDELKARRSVVSSVRDRVRTRFDNVSVAEVGPQDVHDEAVFAFAAVSNDRDYLASTLGKIPDFIDELGLCRVINEETDIAQY